MNVHNKKILNKKKILFTPGDPAGIGLDLALSLVNHNYDSHIIIVADPDYIRLRAQEKNIPITIVIVNDELMQSKFIDDADNCLLVYAVKDKLIQQKSCDIIGAGKPNKLSSPYILETIEAAISLCQNKLADAVVTGAVNKALINEYGIEFTGHTEFFASKTNTKQTVMMLANDTLKVCLATTHIPLKSVHQYINQQRLTNIIDIIYKGLQDLYALENPRITILGLNPHAGEDGHIGEEDKNIIRPSIQALQKNGFHIQGPVSADTAFCSPIIENTDVYLAMYHDQGLPIVKYTGFGSTVNVSLGLPIIRTSVDHGTAYALAATNNINFGSLNKAISLALDFANTKIDS